MVFIQPGTRRGAVLLMNALSIPAVLTAFEEIENGVARLLAGQEPAPASLSLPRLYLIVDAVLGGLFALALWPLLRLRRWQHRLRQQHPVGRGRLARIGLRLAWEFAVPLMLLVGFRLLSRALFGTQSWEEMLLVFPDFSGWIWAISLIMLLTGAARLVFLLRVLRRTDGERGVAAPAGPTRQHPA
jgi:hypothetical protein